MRLSDRITRRIAKTTLSLPQLAKHRLFGPPPTNDRGTRLDADTWGLLRLRDIMGVTRHTDPARARMATRRSASLSVMDPPPHVDRVESLLLGEQVPGRIYYADRAPVPALVFLHGGGWTVGDLETHDIFCRRVCVEAGYTVIAVDYRLAPEEPFPAGLEDALTAWRDVCDRTTEFQINPEHIVLGGDSAGGNLTAAACLVLRDANEPLPWRQLLIYPSVEMAERHPSRQSLGKGYFLTDEAINWYRRQYASPEDDFRASPLLAADHSHLPPAIVVTAGFDPLRDEGEAYIAALRAASVPVEHLEAADLVHAFINMDGLLPAADREVRRLLTVLRSLPPQMT